MKPSKEKIVKIVTHAGTPHSDDFLATCVLLTKFQNATVLRVNSIDDVDLHGAVVVDIGGKYDGETFFDHHHDPELPCSLILVLKKFYPFVPTDLPELQFIDQWDRFGPTVTQKKFGIKLPPFRDPIADAVLKLFERQSVIAPGVPLHSMLVSIGQEFLDYLTGTKTMIDLAKRGKKSIVKGLLVLKYNMSVPIRFVKQVYPGVAIVVSPNQRVRGAYSLTRIDDHPRVDFNRIRGRVPAHFVHPSGLMAVVDPQYIDAAIDTAVV